MDVPAAVAAIQKQYRGNAEIGDRRFSFLRFLHALFLNSAKLDVSGPRPMTLDLL
jgi:hypothetical protein